MTGRFNTVLCASVSGVDSDRETISRSLGHQEKSCGFGEVKSADSKCGKTPAHMWEVQMAKTKNHTLVLKERE